MLSMCQHISLILCRKIVTFRVPCQVLSMPSIWAWVFDWGLNSNTGWGRLTSNPIRSCLNLGQYAVSLGGGNAKTKGQHWGIQTATERHGHKSEANVSSTRQIFQQILWNVLLTLSAFPDPIIYMITLFRNDCWRKRTSCHCKLPLVDKSENRKTG